MNTYSYKTFKPTDYSSRVGQNRFRGIVLLPAGGAARHLLPQTNQHVLASHPVVTVTVLKNFRTNLKQGFKCWVLRFCTGWTSCITKHLSLNEETYLTLSELSICGKLHPPCAPRMLKQALHRCVQLRLKPGVEAAAVCEVNKVNQTLIIYLSYCITVTITHLLLLKPTQLYILPVNYLEMQTQTVATYRYKDHNTMIYPCRHPFIVPLKRETSCRMTPRRHSAFSVLGPAHFTTHQTLQQISECELCLRLLLS